MQNVGPIFNTDVYVIRNDNTLVALMDREHVLIRFLRYKPVIMESMVPAGITGLLPVQDMPQRSLLGEIGFCFVIKHIGFGLVIKHIGFALVHLAKMSQIHNIHLGLPACRALGHPVLAGTTEQVQPHQRQLHQQHWGLHYLVVADVQVDELVGLKQQLEVCVLETRIAQSKQR